MPENKVVFGLKKVHYSVITEDDTGKIAYGTVGKLPGAVEMKLEPKGEQTDFFADDGNYFTESSNQGYEGTLNIANITEAFRTEVLGEVLDEVDKVITEVSNAKIKKIALMFEFDGDVKATRHVLYNVSVSRPSIGSSTKSDKTEPTTTELKFVASQHPLYKVKTSTTAATPAGIYDAWYTKVYEKVVGA
ncbi:phage tail protein [Bacillus cereus]|uniref:major tail protein n=1 Tax=Bacillus cereus TaxID=1396 RepID=UPI000BEBBDF7|nr:major tail protein [Bacillus cereus]PDZ06621.1 phage tail protein [Bacillus cereus]PFN11896.1 phage tail protein [Bacillus cereus]PGY29198.1 phage tail protein [Bacillus cereus]